MPTKGSLSGPFKPAKPKAAKPDKKGNIAVRIFLVNENVAELTPAPGNLREDIFVEDATVGEVAEHLRRLLFGDPEAGCGKD